MILNINALILEMLLFVIIIDYLIIFNLTTYKMFEKLFSFCYYLLNIPSLIFIKIINLPHIYEQIINFFINT